MEEETIKRNPEVNQTRNETVDPSLSKKHASMLERLSNIHHARLQCSLSRKPDSDSSPAFESTQSFLSRFSESKRSIDFQLDSYRLAATADLRSRKSVLDEIASSLSNLDQLVSENSYFLPSYEVRTSLKTIADLKRSLENLNTELIPTKKFTFKKKAAKNDESISVNEPQTIPQTAPDSVSHKMTTFEVRESPGFRNKEGEILIKNFRELEVGEFEISDLNFCEIKLVGCLRVLFIHRVKNCKIYVGPVLSSILIEEAENCVFVLASHQMRIHCAKASDFYLRVRSRPIIEDSAGVRFAPYCLCYEGIEEDLRASNLEEETGNWANVDDFKWLRAIQSPNWSILPENERIQEICLV